MIAVIFEVWLSEGRKDEYLDIASKLKPLLSEVDGFISIERFSSLTEEGKLLSLSFWEDEHSVKKWRELEEHRIAQAKGRTGIFKDYRLRVCSTLRDYSMHERSEAPSDSKEYHS